MLNMRPYRKKRSHIKSFAGTLYIALCSDGTSESVQCFDQRATAVTFGTSPAAPPAQMTSCSAKSSRGASGALVTASRTLILPLKLYRPAWDAAMWVQPRPRSDRMQWGPKGAGTSQLGVSRTLDRTRVGGTSLAPFRMATARRSEEGAHSRLPRKPGRTREGRSLLAPP